MLEARHDLEGAREQAHLALVVFTDLHEHVGTPDSAADLERARQLVEAVKQPGDSE